MEQKYRDIDINKDVRMEGDETSEENTDEWSPIARNNIGRSYAETRVISLKYRRPITEQYVYENAGFIEPTPAEFINLALSIDNGVKYYDKTGAWVTVGVNMGHSLSLVVGHKTIAMTDLHTRKPAPRMMEINGVELVAPETEEPPIGANYYKIADGRVVSRSWAGGVYSKTALQSTGIWLKEEHCKQVIDALQKVFFGGEV